MTVDIAQTPSSHQHATERATAPTPSSPAIREPNTKEQAATATGAQVAAPRTDRRLAEARDARKDEVDAGEELRAVVVLAQLRRHATHERILAGVELRPACGDGREEGRSVRLARHEAGRRGVLSGEAEDV